MKTNKIKIFYDGASVSEYITEDNVVGVTTNTGFLKKAQVEDYDSFIKESLAVVGDKPISFQVFSDDPDEIYEQAKKISSYGDNVYVKVPVVLPNGESAVSVAKRLSDEGVNVNITCVYTVAQISEIFDADFHNNIIVSVFCGRIADCGIDASAIISYAVQLFRKFPHVEILWAGCQRVLDVVTAEQLGVHIVTVPEGVLTKLNRLGNDIHEFSVKTSYDFWKDGQNLKLNG